MNVGLMDAAGDCFAIGIYISIHALALSATLVSNNLSHFRRVQGLQVENWS